MSTRQEQRRLNAAQLAPQSAVADGAPAVRDAAARARLEDRPRIQWPAIKAQLRSHPVQAVAAVVLVSVIILAFLGPYLPLPDGQKQDLVNRLRPPLSRSSSGELHLAGTDQLGRDVLARLLMGARVTLGIALITVLIAGVIGSLLGLLAGYWGGKVDHAIMRLIDLQMAFPPILFAMFLLYLVGATIVNLILLLAILGWVGFTRMARAQTLSVRNMVFVESAQSIGCSSGRILLRHIFPHLVPVLAVIAVFDFSAIMLAEAGLSYLGLGVQPPATSWGRMIAEGQQYVYNGAWWLFLFPGGVIFLVVLATRLTSAWIQDIVGRHNGV